MKLKKWIAFICVMCIVGSFMPDVYAESVITQVTGAVYQNTTLERDGIVWRFSDSVTGTVDTKGTSALTDDVFGDDAVVEPISYMNERGNIEMSTIGKTSVVENTRYDTYIYASDNTHSGAMFSKANFSGDFDLETRFRFDEFLHISLYTGTNRFYIPFSSDSELCYETESGLCNSIEVNLGYNQWHTMKFSVRNKNIGTIYIDGKEVITYRLRAVSTSARLQYFTKHLTDSKNMCEIEYAKLTPVTSELKISSISYGQTFNEGDSISLKTSKSGFLSQATYYINGKEVAKDDWKGSTTLSGLKAGIYDITAKHSSKESAPVRIYVSAKAKSATVSAQESVVYGNNINVKLNTSNFDGISRVEYYLNGELATTSNVSPYSASVASTQVGTASIYAKVVDGDGSYVCSEPVLVNVIHDGYMGSLELSREYMLDYTYGNASQTGKMQINDGYFLLDFSHSGKTVTYKCVDGVKTYEIQGDSNGTGEFKVVVTAGNAEVYYNGQFAFSCLLPYEGKTSGKINYSSLTSVILQGSGVKAERYHTDWNNRDELADYNMNFGLYYSAEFNKNDSSYETFTVYDGEYMAKLTFDERGITAVAQFEDFREQKEFNLSETIPRGYYRLTVARGIAQLFVNNKYINSFMCPATAHSDAVLRKVNSPGTTDFVAIKETDDIYYHKEDFEGNTEIPAEKYFISEYDSKVKAEGEEITFTHGVETVDGSNVLKLWGSGDYALNANAKSPTFKWRAKADGNGIISFICRYMQKGNYVAINYDFESSRWYIDNARVTSDGADTHTEVASVNKALDTNWHNYEIVIEDSELSLFCDGASVISWDGLEAGSGRVGFGVSDDATLFVDDIEYSGEGKASAGLSILYDREIGSKEFYKSNDGYIWTGSASNKQYRSADNGETWEAVNSYTSGNSIVLQSGRFLRVGNQNSKWAKYQTYSRTFDADANWQNTSASWDRGLWGDGKNLIEPDDPFASGFYRWSTMPTRVMQVQDGPYKGRVFYARGMGGERHGGTALFYTDGDFDENDVLEYSYDGKRCKTFVWHPVSTSFAYDDIGINNQESLVVDMPDGSLRYIARTDTGFLCYSESTDGGLNWSEFNPTQLISPRCCFGMVRDPQNLENHYAVWEYDVNSADKQNDGGRPRCRTALAMTSDGMENWQYIMDIHCLTENWRTSQTPQNHSLRVIDNKAYISLSVTGGGYSEILVADLAYAKPLLRFSGAHDRIEAYTDLWDFAKDYTVLSKNGEAALINGESYENIGSDGKFKPEIMGDVLGASVSVSDGGAMFSIGTAKVNVEIDGNGLVDAKDCADAFGKVITETDNAYIISCSPVVPNNLSQLEGMGAELCADKDNISNLLRRLNQAAMYGNRDNIQMLMNEYGDELELTADLTGIEDEAEVYGRMTGYEYYKWEDVDRILNMATSAQRKAEKGDNNLSLSTVSGGMNDWIIHGDSIDASFGVADGIATVTKSKEYGVADFGTLGFDVPDCDEYYVTFRVKTDSQGEIKWGNDEHLITLGLNVAESEVFGIQKSKVSAKLTPNLWYEFRVTVAKGEKGLNIQLHMTEKTQSIDETLSFENVSGSLGEKGFWIGVPQDKTGMVQIENVRIYHGKALDVLEYSLKDGKASANVDFLNDSTEFTDGRMYMAVYNGRTFAGCGSFVISEAVAPYESKNVRMAEFDYKYENGVIPDVKLFMWKNSDGMEPVFEPFDM